MEFIGCCWQETNLRTLTLTDWVLEYSCNAFFKLLATILFLLQCLNWTDNVLQLEHLWNPVKMAWNISLELFYNVRPSYILWKLSLFYRIKWLVSLFNLSISLEYTLNRSDVRETRHTVFEFECVYFNHDIFILLFPFE